MCVTVGSRVGDMSGSDVRCGGGGSFLVARVGGFDVLVVLVLFHAMVSSSAAGHSVVNAYVALQRTVCTCVYTRVCVYVTENVNVSNLLAISAYGCCV